MEREYLAEQRISEALSEVQAQITDSVTMCRGVEREVKELMEKIQGITEEMATAGRVIDDLYLRLGQMLGTSESEEQ